MATSKNDWKVESKMQRRARQAVPTVPSPSGVTCAVGTPTRTHLQSKRGRDERRRGKDKRQ
eukprot:scaffold10579_cov108-Skeletonema_dohrnii-CCMP3373.AAC.3